MSLNKPNGYIPIIGTNFLQPIARLFEELEKEAREPNEVQAAPLDNGFSVSVIVLTILFLESTIQRTQYIKSEESPKKPIKFIRSTYPESGWADKIEELFVVRNVIAHNPIWEAKVYWDDNMTLKLFSAKIADEFGGNRAFKKVIVQETRKTRLLGINLFPTRISRDDALIVLKNAAEFLLFLENKDRNYVYISPQHIMFQGNLVPFTKFVDGLHLRFSEE